MIEHVLYAYDQVLNMLDNLNACDFKPVFKLSSMFVIFPRIRTLEMRLRTNQSFNNFLVRFRN